MPGFGLNDEILGQFGLNDEAVGQSSVTKPAIKPGVGQVANAARYVPQKPQYSDVYEPSQDMPGMPMQQAQRPVQNYTPQQLAGAEQGVNIDAPPAVDTARANFARTKQTRDNYIADLIKQKFGPDTVVRTGADSKTGEPEYFDKDARQWKMASDSFGGKAVNAIPDTLEIAGAIGGSYLPAPGISSALGAGAGRALGVGLKNLVGSTLPGAGAEDYRDFPKAINEGLTATAIAGAGNVVTNGIPMAYRYAIKGKDVVSPGVADSILNSYNKNAGFVKDINASMEKNGESLRYEPNIGRVASLPDERGISNPDAQTLVVNEPLLLRTNKELSDREIKRRATRGNVIELYARNEVFNPEAATNITQANWQERVKQYYDAWKEQSLGPYQQAADDAVEHATQAMGNQGRGQLDEATLGRTVRDAINQASEASEGRVTSAYAEYENAAGYKPDLTSDHQVPLTKQLTSTMNLLNSLKRKGLLKSQSSQAERYTPEVPGKVPEPDKALLDEYGIKYDEGGTVDLAMLDRTIKDLNAEASAAASGTVASDISDANRNLLLRNLKKAREEYLSDKPELSTSLAKAQAEYGRHAKEFKDSFLGTFLTRDNAFGDMRIADPKILDHIMRSKDKLAAQQLAQIVNGEPGAKKAIVDYIDAFYNDKFTKRLADGTLQLDAKKHDNFVRNVLPNLEPFLTKDEVAHFRQLGGIAKEVVFQKEKWNMARKAWKELDPNNVGGRLNSETLVGAFFDPNKSDKTFRFINTRLGPEAMQATRDGIMATIAQKAKNPQTGLVDPDKLAGVVNPIRDRMTQYFGAEKMKAVDNLIRAAQAEKLEVGGKTLSGDTVVSSVARPILGPLSSENRKITALKQLRERNTAYRVEAALYDPNEIPRLVSEIESRRYNAGARSRAGYIILKAGEQVNDN